jgi:hypothetical protein
MEDIKKKQLDWLTQENAAQQERIQQLQRTVEIMQARSAK